MSQDLIYTIGHSNHTSDLFFSLLRQHNITLLVDVRSQPYSRWARQFNRETLAHDLVAQGLAYQFMGDSLGGRPADAALYPAGQESPDYQRLQQTPTYLAGIDAVLQLARSETLALMCGEGDHRQCHRHLLITQTLLERGVRVRHIQPDGSTVEGDCIPTQLSLF